MHLWQHDVAEAHVVKNNVWQSYVPQVVCPWKYGVPRFCDQEALWQSYVETERQLKLLSW